MNQGKVKLTRTAIDGLALPAKGYQLYWDSELRNFGLRVTAGGSKSYFIQRRIAGRERRITLGGSDVYNPEVARKEARKLLGQIAGGADPIAERAKRRAEGVTLDTAFQDYLATRRDLKPGTVADMEKAMEGLKSWKTRSITSLNADQIEKKHAQLGEASKARANLTMRYLRAILNFAREKYTDGQGQPVMLDNPVRALSRRKAWYRIERRSSFIKPHELKLWTQAVLALPTDEPRDYLLFVLLTGLRKNEAMSLPIADVDLKARTFTVTDTKNRQPHTLPLSDHLLEMLTRRLAAADKARPKRKFVFEGPRGRLSNLRYAMESVNKASGVEFSIHDLRRTFATVADALDVPAYALKALLNHKSAGDVTRGYVQVTVERLREPMQKITNYFLAAGGIRAGATVVEMKREVEKKLEAK